MKTALIIGTILLVVAGGFGVSRMVWASPDYATIGVCSASDIDQTYAALKTADGFQQAAVDRSIFEFFAYHPHVRTLRLTFERNLNAKLYFYFGKHKTSAYACGHTGHFFEDADVKTFPDLLTAIRPYAINSDDAARLTACVYHRDPYAPHRLSPETIAWVRKSWAARRR